MDAAVLEMMKALESDNSSINVRNQRSEVNRLYHMNVPFQLTLEYCSGKDPDDYVNIMTLSAEKSLLYQESVSSKNFVRTKDVMHFHDYFEFVVILEGSMIQKIEGKDYLYNAGSCCMINRSLCHMEHYQAQTKVLFIGLSVDFVRELFAAAQSSAFPVEQQICEGEIYRFIMSDLNNPGRKSYLDFIPALRNYQNANHLHTLAENMINTLLYPDFGASYQIRGLICAFLTYLSNPQFYHSTEITLDTSTDFLLFSRITHLFEECDGRMNRSSLEQVLNYSGDYLNRIIHKYTGMCLYDYGMTFCIKKAAKYLTETNDSISSIAAKLGFSNHTHFYTLFKEHYGVTPKEYRSQHPSVPDTASFQGSAKAD